MATGALGRRLVQKYSNTQANSNNEDQAESIFCAYFPLEPFMQLAAALPRWNGLQFQAFELPGSAMPSVSDLVVLSSDRRPVLMVECKSYIDASPESAAQFRRNLLAHDMLPPVPFYLLVYPRILYLWKSGAAADRLPDFSASTDSLLRDYTPSRLNQAQGPRRESLELVMHSWLDDLASGIRQPKDDSEADRMLVNSGVLGQIKEGTVSSRLAL